MTGRSARRNVATYGQLHPRVFITLGITVLWMVAAGWAFFGSDAYTGLQLAVVGFFAAAFLLTPLSLARLSAHGGEATPSYREWVRGEVDLLDGPIEARHAVVLVMLAPMAGAVGITAIGLVAVLAARGAL